MCTWEGKILLCRRAIEPRKGSWTVPAGFMEIGETMIAGAIRETWEEACARIEVSRLAGIYEIPHIGHIHVFYEAVMTSPDYSPGTESEDVALFALKDIPWDELAFHSVRWSLENICEGRGPEIQFGHYSKDDQGG
ncbi:MAG: NUDIX domain-containing protein [Rhodospirillales bacterium]|nr:NUDIX domain-containing protein [Rhodospirillales bacterium]